MRNLVVLLLGVSVLCAAPAQTVPERELSAELLQAFPGASAFSVRQGGPPPHFVAYSGAPVEGNVLGYVFWTTDLEPLERGYDGPIKMLVGVGLDARLKGVVVTGHREPYGYFSVDLPEFALQFAGKDIRDPFRVGEDVDAVSRATITITSSSRAIRNGARRIARALLTPPETPR
jgi:transcriptional regulator of nitric oxide reductase